MGWTFSESWMTRKALIQALTQDGYHKTLRHCCVGNNLWCVKEGQHGNNLVRYIVLYMMKGPTKSKGYTGRDKDWWGYKDIDETMGPNETSCPVSYLEICTAPEGHYAYEWRQRVYAKAALAKTIKVGAVFDWNGKKLTVIAPKGPLFIVEIAGVCYRVSRQRLAAAIKPWRES